MDSDNRQKRNRIYFSWWDQFPSKNCFNKIDWVKRTNWRNKGNKQWLVRRWRRGEVVSVASCCLCWRCIQCPIKIINKSRNKITIALYLNNKSFLSGNKLTQECFSERNFDVRQDYHRHIETVIHDSHDPSHFWSD